MKIFIVPQTLVLRIRRSDLGQHAWWIGLLSCMEILSVLFCLSKFCRTSGWSLNVNRSPPAHISKGSCASANCVVIFVSSLWLFVNLKVVAEAFFLTLHRRSWCGCLNVDSASHSIADYMWKCSQKHERQLRLNPNCIKPKILLLMRSSITGWTSQNWSRWNRMIHFKR